MKPLAELRDWLAGSLARCRANLDFRAAFFVDVAADIAEDAEKHQAKVAQRAYSAEQSDLEAVKLLESAASDGLSACDMPAIAAAIRHIRRSAKQDRCITEALT